MRPGAEFVAMSHRAGAPMVAPAHGLINGTAPHSPWQSPVPYLFGGLAAMLGLIALALLILACSYWKLSGLDNHDEILAQTVYARITTMMALEHLSLVEGVAVKDIDLVLVVSHIL
ncbi:hypothetical protein TRIUR3_12089 [Triticum urartu]|uniref:Uncharacterized protein n=2 Tax=Triticum TaxID=4564 RepID=A0A9R0ZPS4_TRITD|nr:hypothetical protein TRIUR3_12089 [Triticum urartu]VAI80661.1 unnamed protein product [Triticum turgidum subsp. durum]